MYSLYSVTLRVKKLKLDLHLLIIGYNNSVVSYDDISIDQFFVLFFFNQHVITRISSRVPLNCISTTGCPKLLITGYNNSVVSYDDISTDQFFVLFFFTQHVITRISSRVPLNCIVTDEINKLPEDGLKSSPKKSRYIESTWISVLFSCIY